MGTQPGAESADSAPLNYYNYFTEIEEHFQRARGTSLFLLSPLDKEVGRLTDGRRRSDLGLARST